MATDVQESPGPSMTNLVTGIVNDAQELMKQQFALLKVEVQDDLRKTRDAATASLIALGTTLVGAVLLSLALVHLANWAFPEVALWVWYAVIGGMMAALGVGLGSQAYQQFRSFNPLPDESAAALQENLGWTNKRK